MIKKNISVSNVTNVTVCEFGSGSINVAYAKQQEKNVVVFWNREPSAIGTETFCAGRSTDETGLDLMFVFDKPESIDVVIEKLNECKTAILNERGEEKN